MKLCVFGAGISAAQIVDLINWQFSDKIEVEGFYDDRVPAGQPGPGGYPVLGTVAAGMSEVPGSGCSAFVALGTKASAKGCELFLALRAASVELPGLIAPAAHVSPSARLGQNVAIFPGAYIGCEARLGHLCWAHGGAIIQHHSRIGNNVLLAPAATIASFVTIGSHSFIGNGVISVPKIAVGCGSLVGAGALLVRDVPPHVIVLGQPAKPLRGVRSGDEVPVAEDVQKLASMGLE